MNGEDDWFVTTTRLVNGNYPCLHIQWRKDGERAYIGKTKIWIDANNTMPCEHVIRVNLNVPSTCLHFMFDPGSMSALNSGELPSYEISLKDLQWITVWAADTVNHVHHARFKDAKCLPIKSEWQKRMNEWYASRYDAERLAVLTDTINRCKGDPEEARLVSYLNGIIDELGLRNPSAT